VTNKSDRLNAKLYASIANFRSTTLSSRNIHTLHSKISFTRRKLAGRRSRRQACVTWAALVTAQSTWVDLALKLLRSATVIRESRVVNDVSRCVVFNQVAVASLSQLLRRRCTALPLSPPSLVVTDLRPSSTTPTIALLLTLHFKILSSIRRQ